MELKKELLRYGEAAHVLSVSKAHVRRLVEAGELERVFVGGGNRSARITAASIQRYIAKIVKGNGSRFHPP